MKKRHALAAAPLALGLALGMPGVAHADVGTSGGDADTRTADVVSLDALNRSSAGWSLTFSYRCDHTDMALLWISIKQPKPGVPATWDLTSEGTSALSSGWDSQHIAVPCATGQVLQRTHVLAEDEYQVPDQWRTGPVFVQLCLTAPNGKAYKALGRGDSHVDSSFTTALRYRWSSITV